MRKLIQRLLREGLDTMNYDDLFVKIGRLKYYGDGTPEEIAQLPKLEALLKTTPKPTYNPVPEDTRTEWGGVKLGESVSAEQLSLVYDKMGFYADNSSSKFSGDYKLGYVPLVVRQDKYTLSDDYEDLEHLDRVNEYIEVLQGGNEFPPIIFTEGWFHDGSHRAVSHKAVGRKKILAFSSLKVNKIK